MEERIDREIEEKEGLLKDIENPVDLKLFALCSHHKEVLLTVKEYGLTYLGAEKPVFQNLKSGIVPRERVFLHGKNGCGKSSLIQAVLDNAALTEVHSKDNGEAVDRDDTMRKGCYAESGLLKTASGLKISYINQDTSFLKGSIQRFCVQRGLSESLFCSICRQLDLERVQFSKNIEDFSEGQKKESADCGKPSDAGAPVYMG